MNQDYATVIREVKKYQRYRGSITTMLPRLLRDGRELITPSELMEQRINGLPKDKKDLRENSIDTSCIIFVNHNESEVKLLQQMPKSVLDRFMNGRTSSFYDGDKLVTNDGVYFGAGVPLLQSEYDCVNGFTIAQHEFNLFGEDHYALPEKREEILSFLANENQALVRDYIKDVCKSLGKDFNKVIGINLPKLKGVHFIHFSMIDGESDFIKHFDGNIGAYSAFGYLPEGECHTLIGVVSKDNQDLVNSGIESRIK